MPDDDDSAMAKPDAYDAQHRADAWQIVNRAVIEAWNQYLEQHCIPLAEFRQF
jgi:post-segregation antitoxin (ccd killing protein)